jgi:signal transduction histidine kinase
MKGADEIGRLAESFDQMASRVQTSIHDLRTQQTYLQNLINSLPDGLIVVDREFKVEMRNFVAGRLWPHSRLNKKLTEPSLQPEIGQILDRTCQDGELASCEVRLESGVNEGHARDSLHVEIYCSPLTDDRDEIAGAILLIRDVTRRKLFESQASRAERLASVGQLAAGFAHEINNPVAAITTSVEGLSRHVAASDGIVQTEKTEICDYLSTVGEAALRCKEITQRLLTASVERPSGDSKPVILKEVLRAALEVVDPQAHRQKVDIAVACSADEAVVMGSREKLSQLVLNLLLNSLEAVAPGGKIDVSLSQDPESVRLEVSDNGCGIPDDQLERIFDPFFTTKKEGRGTGLGLSISQWIVRQHQGRMRVQSKLGVGTTFVIIFPNNQKGAE